MIELFYKFALNAPLFLIKSLNYLKKTPYTFHCYEHTYKNTIDTCEKNQLLTRIQFVFTYMCVKQPYQLDDNCKDYIKNNKHLWNINDVDLHKNLSFVALMFSMEFYETYIMNIIQKYTKNTPTFVLTVRDKSVEADITIKLLNNYLFNEMIHIYAYQSYNDVLRT